MTGSIHGDADDSMAMIMTVVAHGMVTAIATMTVQMVRSMSGAFYDAACFTFFFHAETRRKAGVLSASPRLRVNDETKGRHGVQSAFSKMIPPESSIQRR